ncbi:MAG TPA: phenylalanine--tRNA ligase subunit beta [Candidatus Limnocylindrales bacterium]|nr:phenylalanine--tRNA ligase subunit beta [Candidatus Limnocylindrales bacterium]
MRVPLSWLADYVDLELSPEALAERLTLLGMEVQGIERIGADWQEVVIGELLEVKPHPNADRLSLTRVRVEPGGLEREIVCGATNIAAGQRIPVALPGAVLPGGRRIERAPKMGVVSDGMLCSGDELGLTADADGILILPPDAPLGRPLAELLGDVVLDVDVKPNRGDALSLVGLAREVSAATGARLRPPTIEVPESEQATADHLHVVVEAPELCPRFAGRYIDGVRLGPAPLQVQLRLTAAGMRPVSNVVDASNYVMLELGKPIHTFDAAAVHEGRIVVRRARAGEELETLDHVRRRLGPDDLVIAHPAGPLALAGVMGGAESEIGEATTSVIIESAIFDPLTIRRTVQRTGLRSEASLRFEKGQEPRLARLGADRTAQLLAAWADGRAARGAVEVGPPLPPLQRLPFRPARVRRLLGVDLPADEQADLLARVEVATEPAVAGDAVPVAAGLAPHALGADASEALVAIVPSHRRDLAVEADIAEEVARVFGYERLSGRLPETPMPAYRSDPRRLADTIRDLLSGAGLAEAVTYALIGPDDHARLGLALGDPATVRVSNPISVDRSELRRSLLPGLVGALGLSERQRRPDVALFELGQLHRFDAAGPREAPWLGLLLAGDRVAQAWDQAARTADLGDAKGLLAWLVDRLHGPRLRFVAGEPQAGVEHPGRTAIVAAEGPRGIVQLGRVAELDPRYLAACEVRTERAAVALVALEPLAALLPVQRRVGPLAHVPSVERDLAVVVPAGRAAGEVEAILREEGGPLLREVRLFDRYVGAPLADGDVSLAYRLRLQADDRTLTDEEVEALLERIVAALAQRLGARRRT